MALNDTTISQASFKLLQGRAHTNNIFDITNEGEPSAPTIAGQEIFSSEIPFLPASAVAQGIAVFVVLDLTLDAGSAGKSYQASIATVSGSALDGYVNPRTGLNYADGDRVGFMIPPKYDDPPPPSPVNSYRAILRDTAVEVAPSSPENWFFDYRAGIVTSETNLSLATGTIEGWVYVGKFVSADIADLIAGSLWELSGLDDVIQTTTGDLLLKNNLLPETDVSTSFGSTALRPQRIYSGPLGLVARSTAGETGTLRTWTTSIDTATNPGYFQIKEGANTYLSLRAGSTQVGVGTATPNELLTVQGVLSLRETAVPSLTAAYGKFYVSIADSEPHFLREDGTDFNLLAGGGGGGGGGGDGYWTTNVGDTVNIYNQTFGKVGIADSDFLDDAQLSVTRITSDTSGVLPIQNIKIKSTGSANEGFGGSINFRFEDGSTNDEILSIIRSVKGSASDDDGELSFSVATAGNLFSTLTLDRSANLTLKFDSVGASIVPTLVLANADNSVIAGQVLGAIEFTSDDLSVGSFTERAYTKAVTVDNLVNSKLEWGLSNTTTANATTKMTLANDGAGSDTTSLTLNALSATSGSSEVVFKEGPTGTLGMKWKYDGGTNFMHLYGFVSGPGNEVGPWISASRGNGYVVINTLTGGGLNLDQTALTVRVTSTGDIVDGFGPSLDLRATDTGVTNTAFGRISAIRADGSDTSGSLQLKTFNAGVETTALHLNFDGKVGINRTAPDYDLEISSTNTATGPVLSLYLDDAAVSTGDHVGSIYFSGLDDGDKVGAKIWAEAASDWGAGLPRASSYLKFSTEDNGAGTLSNSERMTISDRGVVIGPGIEIPDAGVWNNVTLHVHAGSAGDVAANSNTKITVEDSNHTYLSFLTPNNVEAGLLFGDPEDNDRAAILYHHSTGFMQFRTGGAVNRMVIMDNGTVGIGGVGSTPQAMLHVLEGSLLANTHYATESVVVFEKQDAALQILADDDGNSGTALILSAAPGAGNNKHWIINHNGPGAANQFSLAYYTSAGTGDFQGLGNRRLSIQTDGKMHVNALAEAAPIYDLTVTATVPSSGASFMLRRDESITSGETIGNIYFGADDPTATNYNYGAQIRATSLGTWGNSEDADDSPTQLQFNVQNNGSVSTLLNPTMVVTQTNAVGGNYGLGGRVEVGNMGSSGGIALTYTGTTNSVFVVRSSQSAVSRNGITLCEASASYNTVFWDFYLHSNNNHLYFKYGGTAFGGYISSTVDTGQITFTGQHPSCVADDQVHDDYDGYIGMIVISDGTYSTTSDGYQITINDSLPKIKLSSVQNDKRVFGVVSYVENELDEERTFTQGAFVTTLDKHDTRVGVNSVGEGGMWVCDVGGNLENGDYIASSNVPGYGTLQVDDLQHNYTVAKITCDCDFTEGNEYKVEEFKYQGTTYKRAFVGVTYHCG